MSATIQDAQIGSQGDVPPYACLWPPDVRLHFHGERAWRREPSVWEAGAAQGDPLQKSVEAVEIVNDGLLRQIAPRAESTGGEPTSLKREKTHRTCRVLDARR